MVEDSKPIRLVFEEDLPFEKIVELVEVLSELYGEDLDVVSVHDIPPLPRLRKAG